MLLASVPQLDRVAIQLGPFPVYWYGIIIGTGVLLGLWLATREGERLGIPKDTFVDLVLIAVPIAILLRECTMLFLNGNITHKTRVKLLIFVKVVWRFMVV